MADFGGFSVQTPQELIQQLQAKRAQVMTGGNVMQQRSQNIETALDAVFGNPQVRAAQRVQSRIQSAQNVSPKQDGESDIDYELRRLKSVRDAIADVDPSAASQINARMLELGQTKFERTRLMAEDDRAAEKHAADMAAVKDAADLRALTGGATYVFDMKSGSAESFDLLDESQSDAFRKAAAKPGTVVISPQQMFSLYKDTSVEAMKMRKLLAGSDGSKVTTQRVEQASAGLLDLYSTADRVFQVLEANPDVLSASSSGAKAFDKLATDLGAAGRIASGGKTREGQSIDDWLKANAITNVRAQGLVVGLAYATAKANDPSGRISDKDLAAAYEMVGGNNPNPAALVANLNDNLTMRSQALFDRMDTLDESSSAQFTKRRALLQQRYENFQDRFSKYAQGKYGASAAGNTAAPQQPAADADGWITAPNGARVRVKK